MNKRYTETEISDFLKQALPKKAPIATDISSKTGLSDKTLRDLRDFPEKNRNTNTIDKLSKYMRENSYE